MNKILLIIFLFTLNITCKTDNKPLKLKIDYTNTSDIEGLKQFLNSSYSFLETKVINKNYGVHALDSFRVGQIGDCIISGFKHHGIYINSEFENEITESFQLIISDSTWTTNLIPEKKNNKMVWYLRRWDFETDEKSQLFYDLAQRDGCGLILSVGNKLVQESVSYQFFRVNKFIYIIEEEQRKNNNSLYSNERTALLAFKIQEFHEKNKKIYYKGIDMDTICGFIKEGKWWK